jgi:uncharacterized protein
MNALDWIAYTLVLIGGVNWGLIGLFDYNLVAALFGEMSGFTRVVYTLVGLSAVYLVATAVKLANNYHARASV